MIVADTNLLSELMRPRPDADVVSWAQARAPGELYTTSVTVAEILYGIARLPDGRRRDDLRRVADDVFTAFDGHVLAFDISAAEEYPAVVQTREVAGRPISGFNAQIAAICRSNDAALATRNVTDFDLTGIEVIDPWSAT